MPRRLIVCANVGDAVKSAWHALDAATTVVTVFSRPSSEAAAGRVLRRVAVDQSVIDGRGATPKYLSFSATEAANRDTFAQIRWTLQNAVRDIDELWFPAAGSSEGPIAVTHRAATSVRGLFNRFAYAIGDTQTLAGPSSVAELTAESGTQKSRAVARYGDGLEAAQREHFWALGISPQSLPTLNLLPTPAAGRDSGPFLSVLMRTRGDRPQQLDHALESLAAQNDRDFELLLLGHDVPASALEGHLRRLPEWIRAQARIVEVAGGKRGTPLNAGVRNARGRYFAILDDDDEALPEWVSTFHDLYRDSPGQTLRTTVKKVHVDGSKPSKIFPPEFDFLAHLESQQSPPSGLAFPLGTLARTELLFDESLDVLEDWDYLLRAAQYFGVSASPRITSHYCRWPGQPNSESEHSRELWKATAEHIRERYNSQPLLLPPGSLAAIRAALAERGATPSSPT